MDLHGREYVPEVVRAIGDGLEDTWKAGRLQAPEALDERTESRIAASDCVEWRELHTEP